MKHNHTLFKKKTTKKTDCKRVDIMQLHVFTYLITVCRSVLIDLQQTSMSLFVILTIFKIIVFILVICPSKQGQINVCLQVINLAYMHFVLFPRTFLKSKVFLKNFSS